MQKWFEDFKKSDSYSQLQKNPVAYFCMEYALPEDLPIYSGGLGVLAGDYILEADEQKFPMVAIGLFYSQKCYTYKDGNACVANNNRELNPVNNEAGSRIIVTVPIENRNVAIQAWLVMDGAVPVYLMDTNLSENDPADRNITSLLYVSDPSVRLKQEMVLGIGGVRLLKEMGIMPSLYHMNEGHSAFLAFELISAELKIDKTKNFDLTVEAMRSKTIFTNHTLVVSGHDLFDNGLVGNIIKSYADETGLSIEKILELGEDRQTKKFSTTVLAIRTAGRQNAVSQIHGDLAQNIWPEAKIISVTNGININRWDHISDNDLILGHKKNKRLLLDYIKEKTDVCWKENELVIGWARRLTGYKRPISLFDNLEELKNLVYQLDRPMRIVFAGYPHYLDEEGDWLLQRLRHLAENELKGTMVYLEGYNVGLAKLLVSGVDIWLNTPIVGQEACGTSGMKAALNGTLPCSTTDGWMAEVDLDNLGFPIEDQLRENLLITIREKIIPTYYEWVNGKNSTWKNKMISCREEILKNFGTDRMLKAYIEKLYKPALDDMSSD